MMTHNQFLQYKFQKDLKALLEYVLDRKWDTQRQMTLFLMWAIQVLFVLHRPTQEKERLSNLFI